MDIQWKEFFLNWKIDDEDFKKALLNLVDSIVSDERYDSYTEGYNDGQEEGYEEGYDDGREASE